MMEKAKENLRDEHDTSQEALMMAIGFEDEDLEANQNGLLSEFQRKRIRLTQGLWFGFMGLSIALFSFVVLTQMQIRIANNLWRSVILGILIAAFAAFSWRKFRLLAGDIQDGSVRYVEGDLRKRSLQNPSFKSTDYFLTINSVRFSVRSKIYNAFKNGDPYAIYYAPHSKTILSAEWLRPESEQP
jgi:hypothetical protein